VLIGITFASFSSGTKALMASFKNAFWSFPFAKKRYQVFHQSLLSFVKYECEKTGKYCVRTSNGSSIEIYSQKLGIRALQKVVGAEISFKQFNHAIKSFILCP
jgi:hypothetical protein